MEGRQRPAGAADGAPGLAVGPVLADGEHRGARRARRRGLRRAARSSAAGRGSPAGRRSAATPRARWRRRRSHAPARGPRAGPRPARRRRPHRARPSRPRRPARRWCAAAPAHTSVSDTARHRKAPIGATKDSSRKTSSGAVSSAADSRGASSHAPPPAVWRGRIVLGQGRAGDGCGSGQGRQRECHTGLTAQGRRLAGFGYDFSIAAAGCTRR